MLVASAEKAAVALDQNLRLLEVIPNLVIGVVVFIIILLVAKIVSNSIKNTKLTENSQLVEIIAKVIKYIIIVFGLLVSLSLVGINLTTLVTGFGLTATALSLALRDVLANIIYGVMILAKKPISIGDKIKVQDNEGVIIKVDMRYTTMECEEGIKLIPNGSLFTNTITIFRNQ